MRSFTPITQPPQINSLDSIKGKSLAISYTPEQLKYIRRSTLDAYIIKPLLQRGAWFLSLILFATATVPLALKAIANLLDTLSTPASIIEAGKNFAAAIIFPLVGGVAAGLSILLPTTVGTNFVGVFFLPAGWIYRYTRKTPTNKRSIKEEVGPRDTPVENVAFVALPARTLTIPLPPNRIYPEVRGIDGVVIDTVDIPLEQKPQSQTTTSHYRIMFNASAEYYQLKFPDIVRQNRVLNCNTRTFNYPGITQPPHFRSIHDLINAGIAEVYDLAKRMNWSNSDVEENLHLYGYCFGGGIALQVAVYFKERHNVNLMTFIDRSYASLQKTAATLINRISGLPLWYAKILTATVLYAGGDLNMDSVAAIHKLDFSKVNYLNLGYADSPILPAKPWQKVKQFFGIGPMPKDADVIIHDGYSLTAGLAERKPVGSMNTYQIFSELNFSRNHIIYSQNTAMNGHFETLDKLYMDKKPIDLQNATALDFYATLIDSNHLMTNVPSHVRHKM